MFGEKILIEDTHFALWFSDPYDTFPSAFMSVWKDAVWEQTSLKPDTDKYGNVAPSMQPAEPWPVSETSRGNWGSLWSLAQYMLRSGRLTGLQHWNGYGATKNILFLYLVWLITPDASQNFGHENRLSFFTVRCSFSFWHNPKLMLLLFLLPVGDESFPSKLIHLCFNL